VELLRYLAVEHWLLLPLSVAALLALVLWLARAVPLQLAETYCNWTALVNLLRAKNAFGMDRRQGTERRQHTITLGAERRSGIDRRRGEPPVPVARFGAAPLSDELPVGAREP
jgi:hypothetical protein